MTQLKEIMTSGVNSIPLEATLKEGSCTSSLRIIELVLSGDTHI
jgi:hypothetical protein